MAITSIHCHILQSNVACVVDLEGRVEQVICTEFDKVTGDCRLQKVDSSGGPLSALLGRASEGTLGTRTGRCYLR